MGSELTGTVDMQHRLCFPCRLSLVHRFFLNQRTDFLGPGTFLLFAALSQSLSLCFAAETPIEEFTPTPAFPALQYLESVDVEGVAWRAGLRTGDFLIEVSGRAPGAASSGTGTVSRTKTVSFVRGCRAGANCCRNACCVDVLVEECPSGAGGGADAAHCAGS